MLSPDDIPIHIWMQPSSPFAAVVKLNNKTQLSGDAAMFNRASEDPTIDALDVQALMA